MGRISNDDLDDGGLFIFFLKYTHQNMIMIYKKRKRLWRLREEVTKRYQVHLFQNAKELNW